MTPEDPPHDEDYASEEDSDFALDDAPAEESSVSDDEEGEVDGADTSGAGKRKRQGEDAADDGAGFENSGDEAIIEKGKRRQKKSKKKDGEADDDEGGEGGLIKTRRMRAAEYASPPCPPSRASPCFANFSAQKGRAASRHSQRASHHRRRRPVGANDNVPLGGQTPR